MITLYDFQESLLSRVSTEWRDGGVAPMLVLLTGGGKTTIFCEATRRAARRGKRTLILVHRRELLKQASRTLDGFGIEHSLIASGMSFFHQRAVQVASVQTLVKRLGKLRGWSPDLIIVDECHHAVGGNTWGRVLEHFDQARVLGVTATPQRMDGKGLGVDQGGFFDRMVVGPSVAELTARGYLSPAVVYAPKQQIDLSGVKTRMGDWAPGELAAAVDRPMLTGDAVAHYQRLCAGEPAIAFCASVAHAEHVAESFRAAGFQAASVDGSLPASERERRIADLGRGELHVLTSCDIISEGTDIPVVSAAIMLRPTQSVALALQQMGRALRVYPGKQRAVILDHAGNVFRHGLPDDARDWSLAGQPKKGKARQDDAAPVKQCGQCYTVHRPAPACPACGFVYPVNPREIEHVDGDLEEITAQAMKREHKREQGAAQSMEQLVALGRARGYKNPYAWASHIWNARQHRRAAA